MSTSEPSYFQQVLALVIAFFAKDIFKLSINALVLREEKGESNMQLTQAWDVKALVSELKAKGLDVTEEVANDVLDSVLDWVDQSVSLTPTPLDDLEKVVSAPLRPMIKSQIDKINGKVG